MKIYGTLGPACSDTANLERMLRAGLSGMRLNLSHVSIVEAEPIGPQRMFDVLVIAPCTGNTAAKLCHGITDSCVTMAAKSHLRGGGSVLLAIGTNDGLSGSAKNIGELLNRRNIYFVPFYQDDPSAKPRSLASDYASLERSILAAARGEQAQPILAKL